MLHHKLECLKTGDIIEDEYTLNYTEGALLRAKYSRKLTQRTEEKGVWQFADWLPTSSTSEYHAGTVTYKAEKLGEKLGMSNLWVTFHGYWPEKGAMCPTGTFKDMEAVPTLVRLKDHNMDGIICASAGNTARAFSYFCTKSETPLIVIVGKDHAGRIWLPEGMKENDAVKVVVITDGDYYDAKMTAKGISAQLPKWQLEGGAHNVARRDGIGSLILDAAFTIGKLPTNYFQGIGGGPGPIGVHEMAIRAIETGLFEGPVPRQHVSQNPEHSPIHNAWQAGREKLQDSDFPPTDVEVYSDFLMNKAPCYNPVGGVHDILKQSNGQTYLVEKEDAVRAKQMFEEIEGIDILSPAAVAFASMMQALESGDISHDECTVLNISGGGIDRLSKERALIPIKPWLECSKYDAVELILSKL